MYKKLLFIFLLLFIAGLIVFFSGFYPVVLVKDKTIFKRKWMRAEFVAENFANAELQKEGDTRLDFYKKENEALRRELRKNTLTFLVEDAILQYAGQEMASDFDTLVKKKVDDVVEKGKNIPQTAFLIYGVGENEFKDLILYPQARRDVIRDFLKKQNKDFETWFSGRKKEAPIRFFIREFWWNGERVE